MSKTTQFLEVDPSIIEKNITFVKDWSIEDELKNSLSPSQSGITVKPLPGICVKVKLKKEDKKFFINVCHTESMPSPEDISQEELIQILQSDKISNYRIPMSISNTLGAIKDKCGQPATVCDVAISTKFLNKIQRDEIFNKFFLSIIFEAIEQKFEIELDTENQVILKNKKSVGNIQVHRIQNRVANFAKDEKPFKPLIEEIDEKDIKNIISKKSNPKEIMFRLSKYPKETKIKYLVAEFQIESNLRSEDILLDVGEDRILVEIPKTNQIADVYVPYRINQERVECCFNKNTNILLVATAAEEIN